MNPSDPQKQIIDQFLTAVEPLTDAYQNDSFSYVAAKTADSLVLVQGTLYLNVNTPIIPLKTFESKCIQAGHFYLKDVGLSRDQVIAQLCDGKLAIPGGELAFPGNNGHYGVQYQPYHEIGLRSQSRLIHLTLMGNEIRHYIEQPNLDWELRAADTPYDGMQDLLNEFQPGNLRSVISVDIAAFTVVVVDAQSAVAGESATLMLRSALSADKEKISVGVRITEQGKVVKRERIAGNAFEWEDKDGFKLGTKQLAVPKAAVVHAVASYNGVALQHYFFGDPASFQNPRRAAYEAFDQKLAKLNDILTKAQGSRDSRDFEAAMPWLFWMLGFAPAHVGGLPKSSNAADFLAASPSGHLAVVECTVGLLKDDDKLPKLHDRAQAVRRNLDVSSTRYVRVLPVIITAKSAEEVKPDVEQAEKLGIYVITREGIERLLLQTLTPANADQLYEQAEQAARSAKEAREMQASLPLG
jgi:hypothetical protein